MSRPSGSRKTASHPESVHGHLNMYALAAVVIGLIALTQPSEAKIVYTPTNIQVDDPYNLDLNNDGITDFILQQSHEHRYFCNYGPFDSATLTESPSLGSNGVIVDVRGSQWAVALFRGGQIGPARIFNLSNNYMAGVFEGYLPDSRCKFGRGAFGHWVNVSDRYLGIEFQIKGKTHYGWARLSVQAGYVYINATLTGYAYETIPGKSIKAGQTKGMADDPTNEDFGASVITPIPATPKPHRSAR